MKKEQLIKKRAQLRKFEQKLRAHKQGSFCGIDEVGRGSLAGPVVASAIVIEDWNFKEKIDDSKRLTSYERQRAFYEILSKARVGFGIVPHQIIDQRNIYQATLMAMEEALKALKAKVDFLLIDGPIKLSRKEPQMGIIGGDGKIFSIACASIAAKVLRDDMMESYGLIYPKYGFAQHKGYGTPEHIKLIKKYGYSSIHRRSFKIG